MSDKFNCIPKCKKCKQTLVFDMDEPFASCKCGTAEWSSSGDVYRQIQSLQKELEAVKSELKKCRGILPCSGMGCAERCPAIKTNHKLHELLKGG